MNNYRKKRKSWTKIFKLALLSLVIALAVNTFSNHEDLKGDITDATVLNQYQTIIVNDDTPSPITISSCVGACVFNMADDGDTGLTGAGVGNTYTFTGPATGTGTATVTITDNDTPVITATVTVNALALTVDYGEQTIFENDATPTTITVDGGVTPYNFSVSDPDGTGLTRLGTDADKFVFAGPATDTGRFIVTITDAEDEAVNAEVNVQDSPIDTIAVSSTCSATMYIDDTCTLTATATFEDGSTGDISSSVNWLGTGAIGTLDGFYLTITESGTTAIFAEKDDITSSNNIAITTQRNPPEILSVRTAGNVSLTKGTHEDLFVEVKDIYGIGDLDRVEVSLIKGTYCAAVDITPSAQYFDIIETGTTPSFSVSGKIALLEIPILIPVYEDITDGDYTILVKLFNSDEESAQAVYQLKIGIPAEGDVNFDGIYSVVDAVLAMKFYEGTRTPTATELKAADLDEDGSVDLLDVLAVFRAVSATQNKQDVSFTAVCP